jgi:hypothetical protein
MDKDQAMQEVHEIKQVMDESRKRSSHFKYWIGPALSLLAIIISGLAPLFTPLFSVILVVVGIVTWRRNNELKMKVIAAVTITIGIALLLIIVSLVGFHNITTTTSTTTVTP